MAEGEIAQGDVVTRSEVPFRTLGTLGLADAAETVETAESNAILAVYDSVYEALAVERLVSWGPTEAVPKAFELPVLAIVAEHYRPAAQAGTTNYDTILAAKNTMRRLYAGPAVTGRVTPEYF